ncbi:hypothetical protein FACS1894189_4880 [Planctomycetales bacterium]|nr:hypothetical protein FACS1894189_4880 [Planctomycetales bacterium]
MGPPPGRGFGPPPPPHHRHGPSDFDKALGVIGAVGAISAIANGYSPYGYYRRQPDIIVVPSRPSTVVVEKQVVVEKPVVIEKPVYIDSSGTAGGSYSPKLGASFRIEKMQIPGYKFTAARLTSDPVEGSPLNKVGLRKGDVITRLDDSAVDSLGELESHEKNTLMRYIKTGTTKVQLAQIYVPVDSEVVPGEDTYNAP